MTKGLPFVVAYGMDALQPTNLDLKGAHSTLEFNQDGEDFAKDCDTSLGDDQAVGGEISKVLQSASQGQKT